MTSLDSVFRERDLKEAADVTRRILDVKAAERARTVREDRKDKDAVLASTLANIGTDKPKSFSGDIREYWEKSLLLKQIGTISDHASAVEFLKNIPGVEEISNWTYKDALREGQRITAELKKDGLEPFDENIARCMVPVLLRCEYLEGSEFVQRCFFALHDSFARKVVQDVKERLREIFADRVTKMQESANVGNARDFLFAMSGGRLVGVAKARIWLGGFERRYVVLLERLPKYEEIKVVEVVSAGTGPDELSSYIGKVFRYKVYAAGGELYPELRNLREYCHPLYRFLLKVLDNSGWKIPNVWPKVWYPYNW